MHISNPEFDAAIGDLKASLDKLQIPNKEQKELLAIVESTREAMTSRSSVRGVAPALDYAGPAMWDGSDLLSGTAPGHWPR